MATKILVCIDKYDLEGRKPSVSSVARLLRRSSRYAGLSMDEIADGKTKKAYRFDWVAEGTGEDTYNGNEPVWWYQFETDYPTRDHEAFETLALAFDEFFSLEVAMFGHACIY